MRIAQINLPLLNNDGAPVTEAHEWLQRNVCRVFGGYTVWEGQGAWMHEGKLFAEPVAVYQIAMPFKDWTEKDASPKRIREIAKEAASKAGQLAVFVMVDGDVEIIAL